MKMAIYKNRNWKTRDWECTNIVAVEAPVNPDPKVWEEASREILKPLEHLFSTSTGKFWGYA